MTLRRIGLFGGSFNPPHSGHVTAALRALEALALEMVVVLPAGTPPHKELPPETPSAKHRLAMTRLAFGEHPGCFVSDLEMCVRMPIHTYQTIRRMRSADKQHILIVGSDMFLTLHEWVRAEEFLPETGVAVLVRAGGQEEAVGRQAEFLAGRYGAAVERIEHTPVEISSTELRAMLKTGRGREYIPGSVYDYIREKKLYGVASYDA